MFFNHRLFLGLSLFALSFLVSCGLKVGEKPINKKTIDIRQQKHACLEQFGKNLADYFSAQMNEEQTEAFFDCVQSAITTFETYTQGQKSDVYHPMEIKNFLNRFFVKNRTINDEYVRQTMKLKVGLLGGQESEITRAELDQLKEFLSTLKTQAVKMVPYIPVLNLRVGHEWLEQGRRLPAVSEATIELAQAAKIMGAQVKSSQPYSLLDFGPYLTELRNFTQWNQNEASNKPAEAWAQFLRAFKSVVTKPTEDKVWPEEWPVFLSSLANWYGLYLNYHYNLRPEQWLLGQGLEQLVETTTTGLDLVQEAIENQPRKVITYKQLEDLVDGLEALNFIPPAVSSETLRKLLYPTITKIFGDPTVPASQRHSQGLDRVALSRARTEFYQWLEVQEALARLYQSEMVRGYTLAEKVNPIRQLMDLDLSSAIASVELDPANSFLKRIKENIRPLFKEGDPRAYIVKDSVRARESIVAGFYDLSIKNAMSPALRLIISGYSEEPERSLASLGLTSLEMQGFINDVRDLARDLNILHPKAENVGERLYLEGNLFTYSGDGINPPKPDNSKAHLLVFEEGLELLSFMLSNIGFTDNVYKDLVQICERGPTDVFQRYRIERNCFGENFRTTAVKYFSHAEGMRDYLASVNEEDWNQMYSLLLAATKKWDDQLTPVPQWVQYTQLATMSMILHYIEAIMTNFDLNEDDRLDEQEGRLAFHRFQGLLEKILKSRGIQKTPEEMEEIFIYILSYGEIPTEDLGTWLNFVWGRNWSWGINLDRLSLLHSFSLITAQAQKKNPNPQEVSPPSRGQSTTQVPPNGRPYGTWPSHTP